MPRPSHPQRPVIAGLVAVLSLPVPAAAQPPSCPQPSPRQPPAPGGVPPAELPVQITAEKAEALNGQTLILSGNVLLRRDDLSVRADRLRYDKATQTVRSTGSVLFQDATGAQYQTQALEYNLGTQTGSTGPGRYSLQSPYAHGDAQSIMFVKPGVSELRRVRYTTCPPGHETWYLSVHDLYLDHNTDLGTAHSAVLRLKDVPVFYWPYLSFPLSNRRKSGFLVPRVGTSGTLGTIVAVPYYWNLAPNYDDTITPRVLSKRGLQLENDFRYLGDHASGDISYDLLPYDPIYGASRSALRIRHDQTFAGLWSANVDYQHVSDTNYLNDFGNSLAVTSQTQLPQKADLGYHGDALGFNVRTVRYQTLDPTIAPASLPYEELPQIDLYTTHIERPNTLNFRFNGQATNFVHSVDTQGQRLNLDPTLSLPLETSYGFLKPTIGADQISYHLDGVPNGPSLTRGVFSLDSGLYLDRAFTAGGRDYTQTLEPRLFYLYVPYANQDNLPVFDTALPTLSFDNLFRQNRFVGGDRIGDANQLAAGLTTRVIDDTTGVQRARFSIGQIYYFTPPQVNLPGALPTPPQRSDIVAETEAAIGSHWSGRATLLWGEDIHAARQTNLALQYQGARNTQLSVNYQFLYGQQEQVTLAGRVPLGGSWALHAYTIYSVQNHQSLETYGGIEYRSCCWAVQLSAQRSLTTTGQQVQAVMIELELTGLGAFGKAQ